MFGWFAPKCPVDLYQKTWTEYRMRWLADQLGIERLRSAQVVLPTEEFFPGSYHGDPKEVRALLDYLAGIMRITTPIELEIGAEIDMPDANGLYIAGAPPKIRVRETILADPFDVVATLLHELAHEILLGGSLLDASEADHEHVTDLLLIFLGVGVIPANNVLKDRAWREGNMEYFQIRRSGYLAATDFGYAFALFAFCRGEDDPPWARHLRPDVLSVMRKGLTFLAKTGDSIFHPDTVRRSLQPPAAPEANHRLREGVLSEQVFTLWQLERNPLTEPAIIEEIETKLASRDWVLAASAADALGSARQAAASAVPSLLRSLHASHPKVRAASAAALGKIQAEPEKVIPSLMYLLGDSNADVVALAGYAVGLYGSAAREASPHLLRALDAALSRSAPGASLTYLLTAFMLLEPEPQKRVHEFYEDGNDEHRDHLLEMIDDWRSTVEAAVKE